MNDDDLLDTLYEFEMQISIMITEFQKRTGRTDESLFGEKPPNEPSESTPQGAPPPSPLDTMPPYTNTDHVHCIVCERRLTAEDILTHDCTLTRSQKYNNKELKE